MIYSNYNYSIDSFHISWKYFHELRWSWKVIVSIFIMMFSSVIKILFQKAVKFDEIMIIDSP